MRAVRGRRLILALILSSSLSWGAPSAMADSPVARDPSAAQQELVARFGGRTTDYQLVAERDIMSGPTALWAAKFQDARTGDVRLIYRDATGRTGGPEVRREAIESSLAGRPAVDRKASGELRARAAEAASSELLPIAVWMDVDTNSADAAVIAAHPEGQWLGDRPNVNDIVIQRRLRAVLDSRRAEVYRNAAAEIEAAIAPDGGRIGYVSLLAPLVYIDTPAASLEHLASLDRVSSLGLEGRA